MHNTTPTRAAGNPQAAHSHGVSIAPRRYQDDHGGNAGLEAPAENLDTSREQLGWQVRAARVLTGLLTMAVRDALPRLGWTVGSVGASVAGRCYGRTATERRREFQAWCIAVGATPRPEIASFDGSTELRAIAARYDGLVDVVVLADLYPEGGDDQ